MPRLSLPAATNQCPLPTQPAASISKGIGFRVLDYNLFHACTAQVPTQGHGQTGDPLITNWASDWRLRSTASAAYLTGFFTSALLGYHPNEHIDVSVDRSGIPRTTSANIGAEQTVR